MQPDERAFLDAYDPSEFERPSVTVDVVILTVEDGRLKVLLGLRDQLPQRGLWGLPGSFVRMEESLDAAAVRSLTDQTGLEGVFLEQLYTFGAPGRDPRMRIITTAYFALVPRGRLAGLKPSTVLATLEIPWSGEEGGPVSALHPDTGQALPLAFDHGDVLSMAVRRLRGKLSYTDVAFALVPEEFTLFQLRAIHEAVLARDINKDSFRRKVLASGLVEATGRRQADVGHRPAELYRSPRKDRR